jgi:hypothetical protein
MKFYTLDIHGMHFAATAGVSGFMARGAIQDLSCPTSHEARKPRRPAPGPFRHSGLELAAAIHAVHATAW